MTDDDMMSTASTFNRRPGHAAEPVDATADKPQIRSRTHIEKVIPENHENAESQEATLDAQLTALPPSETQSPGAVARTGDGDFAKCSPKKVDPVRTFQASPPPPLSQLSEVQSQDVSDDTAPGAVAIKPLNKKSSMGGEDDPSFAATLTSEVSGTTSGAVGVNIAGNDADNTPNIVAHLAPSDDDVAARVAAQIGDELQLRLQQVVNAQFVQYPAAMVATQDVVDATVTVGTEEYCTSAHACSDPAKKAMPLRDEESGKICGVQRNKLFVLLLVLLVLVAGAVAGAIVAISGDNDHISTEAPTVSETTNIPTTLDPTDAPTPTLNPRRDYLIQVLGPQIAPNNATEEWALLADLETPQGQALRWLSEEDEYSLDPQSVSVSALLERYVLAVFYFATSGSNWLIDFPYLDGSRSVCDWNNGITPGQEDSKGIYCTDASQFGMATYMRLHSSRLLGVIPWEISLLEELINFYMEYNDLRDTLPPEIGSMTKLRAIWVHSNSVVGQIPETLPVELEELRLTENFFSGSLPTQWGGYLSKLKYMMLGFNDIHGSIPTEIGGLGELVYIDFEGNDLTGTIPTEIGLLSNLDSLYMEKNQLTGTIPSEIGHLSDLWILYLYGNTGLTGTLPDEISNLESLEVLRLDDTSLTGSTDHIFCPMEDFIEVTADCGGTDPEIECSCCQFCCLADGDSCVTNDSGTPFPTPAPTSSPTNARRMYILDTLGEDIVRDDTPEEWALFDDPTTPQAQALQWLSEDDDFSSDPASMEPKILLERYVLAVLYFSTSGPDWSLDFPYLDVTKDVCEWNNGGVTGQEGTQGAYCTSWGSFVYVTYFRMHELGMAGTIPWEISLLEHLYAFYVENNELVGTLPPELGDLTGLIAIWAHENSLTGQIPGSWGSKVEELRFTSNFLSGTLPIELASPTSRMKYLQFGQNMIHGTFPPELSTLNQIYYIDLEDNQISGTIPTEIGLKASVEYLFFEYNDLTGTLPSEIGNLSDLQMLWLKGNSDLTGTVPEEFGSLDNLISFSIMDTALTGSLDGIFCPLENEDLAIYGDCQGSSPEIECSCCYVCCESDGEDCVYM